MDIIKEAKEYAVLKKSPPLILLEIPEKKVVELSEKFSQIDKLIVHVGVLLMDIMIADALKMGKIEEHVKMSMDATKEFLKNYDIPEEDKNKIIHCVEAHHRNVPFESMEAEICANADCYKFIHPRGFFYYLTLLGGERGLGFSQCLDQAEKKIDEKYKILSLPVCKSELEDYYNNLKKYINDARNFI